jgi:hypothetical protein
MKWTAFDQETAAALAQHLSGVDVSQTAADALDSAITAAADAHVALVTPATGEATLLVTFRTKNSEAAEAPAESAEPVGYQAGGFLGLTDEPLFDDEQHPRC